MPSIVPARLIALAVAALAIAACDRPERPARPSATAADTQATGLPGDASPTALVAEDSGLTPEQRGIVLARVGDHAITLGELEFRLSKEAPAARSQFASVAKRKEYLARMIQFEVLAAEARQRGLERHPEVVEVMKQQMVRRLLLDALGEDDVAPAPVGEAELRAYYDANPGLYHKPEQVEVSHILLGNAQQAEDLANLLRTQAKGSTARLVALWNERVGKLSLDQASAPYLGNLGMLSRELPPGATPAEIERLQSVPKAVVEAAFALEPHTIGPVVASPQGFHVLMVTSRSPAVDRSFDEVKDSIRARIVKRERDLARQKFLDDLRARTRVEITDDAVRLIPTPGPDRAPRLGKGGGDGHDHESEAAPAPGAPEGQGHEGHDHAPAPAPTN